MGVLGALGRALGGVSLRGLSKEEAETIMKILDVHKFDYDAHVKSGKWVIKLSGKKIGED